MFIKKSDIRTLPAPWEQSDLTGKLESVNQNKGREENGGSPDASSVYHPLKKVTNFQFLISNFPSRAGFSIIELIIGVMIIGIAFVAAMFAYAQIQSDSNQVESTLRSTTLGNSIMRIIRSKNYDENVSPPWSAVLGAEEGSISEFDDVDDYIGYDWPTQLAGFPGYAVNTRVFYVNPAYSWTDSIGVITDYKRIIVSINNDGLPKPIVLSSIITPHRGSAGAGTGLGAPPPPPPGF